VKQGDRLPDSSFLVLALLAEGETHGYDIQRLSHNRGFRFWTQLRRSTIYNALTRLEEQGLISAHLKPGEGPDRKVYRITKRGLSRLRSESIRHLSAPGHPRNELDLGIYALPFLSREEAQKAIDECLGRLRRRLAFLEERAQWCRAQNLRMPALAFERPLHALRQEVRWLEDVAAEYSRDGASREDWAQYVYREPPSFDVDGARADDGEENGV
jgi:DNA-binding PadR family transcriptional regulator